MSRIHVISDGCIKDMRCIAVCVRKAIHPARTDPGYAIARQLHIDPKRSIGCGACVRACLSGAISEIEDLPRTFQHFAQVDRAWYGF